MSIGFALSNICKRLLSHTQKPVADPGIILGCYKILQENITIRCVKSKGFYCKLFWPKLHRKGDIMALAWVTRLNE